MIKKLLNLALLSLIIGSLSNLSANEGWYAGFGMGTSKHDLKIPTIIVDGTDELTIDRVDGFDDSDFQFMLNGGYRLNDYVALNLDFSYTQIDAGVSGITATDTVSESFKVDSYYFTPGVHLIYPINSDFEVYGKLGLSIVLSDGTYEARRTPIGFGGPPGPTITYQETVKDWDIAPTIGFGGQWNFGENWAATFEYTYTEFTLQPTTNSRTDYSGTDLETQNFLFGLRYRFK